MSPPQPTRGLGTILCYQAGPEQTPFVTLNVIKRCWWKEKSKFD